MLTLAYFGSPQKIFSQESLAVPASETSRIKSNKSNSFSIDKLRLNDGYDQKLYKPVESLSYNGGAFHRDKNLALTLYSINLDSGKNDSSRLKTDTSKNLTKEQKEFKGYESKNHLLVSLAEVALIEYIPFAMAKYLRNWEESGEVNWTKVSWDTWRKNLREGFNYDGDNFLTNYFSHPYHGSLYYNAGRTNGYDFWQSSIYAFIGSGVWEMFGETFRPSFNDLVNTTVNGINFGETLFRLSAMVTDNRASGFGKGLARSPGRFN